MTSLLTKADLPARLANRELTDGERYEYASHRYGQNFLWIRKLKTGRFLVGNQARDAVAVVETWEELAEVLTIAHARDVRWGDIENAKRVRNLEQEKQTQTELGSILAKINI